MDIESGQEDEEAMETSDLSSPTERGRKDLTADQRAHSDILSKAQETSHTHAILPRGQDFEFIKPISKGAFGKVWLGCKRDKPEKLYAIKVMKKDELVKKNLIAQVTAERDAQARSRSPFVVQLYYSIQSQQNIMLVMEYMIGGDVKSLLIMYGFFPEEMACMYAAEVTLALEYLHRRGIVHRDLKPDNMLISETGHIKLTDFGLSKVTVDYRCSPQAGTVTPFVSRGANRLDLRTPGQLLSLSSSLAFTSGGSRHCKLESHGDSEINHHSAPSEKIPTCSESELGVEGGTEGTSPEERDHSPPLLEHRPSPLPPEPRTPLEKGHKQLFVRRMLTPSTNNALQTSALASTPPVKSLTPTLQDSLTWRTSSASDSRSRHACSLLQYSLLSRSAWRRSVSFTSSQGEESPGHSDCGNSAAVKPEQSLEFEVEHQDSSGDTSDLSHSLSREGTGAGIGGEGSVCRSASGVDLESSSSGRVNKSSCADSSEHQALSCDSHILPMFRVEGEEDSTPLLHRTDDSVWKSFSAKNLRSMQDGSYSDAGGNLGNSCSCGSPPPVGSGQGQRQLMGNLNPGTFGIKPPDLEDGGGGGNGNTSVDGDKQVGSDQDRSQQGKSAPCSLHSEHCTTNENGDISNIHKLHPPRSSLLSVSSMEKARGVLSALDSSVGEIHRTSRSLSIAGSVDMDLSSDFSSHFQRETNLNSTRLSMDFGQSKISLDFGPELKDLSQLSGLCRLPLRPLPIVSNTESQNIRASGASRESLSSSQPATMAQNNRKGEVLKRKLSDYQVAPGSGGELFKRRLSKPGLRRVLSDTFDKCQLSDTRDGIRHNVLSCKSKSMEISDTSSCSVKDVEARKHSVTSPKIDSQRKRSCHDALIEAVESPEAKVPCKISVPHHSGLTPDLRRLAMRNNVQHNLQEPRVIPPSGLICSLFKASKPTPEISCSQGFQQTRSSTENGVGNKQKQKENHVAVASLSLKECEGHVAATNQSGVTCEINAMALENIVGELSKGSHVNSLETSVEKNKTEQGRCRVSDVSFPLREWSTKAQEVEIPGTPCVSLHRVPACTNLAAHLAGDHCDISTPPLLEHTSPCAPVSGEPGTPEPGHVKFFQASPSPGPTMHSSPAAGGQSLTPHHPPLIIKKGVSTNDSIGQDGSFLNMSIEFELNHEEMNTSGTSNVKATCGDIPIFKDNDPRHTASGQIDATDSNHSGPLTLLQLPGSPAKRRSRSSSSNSSNVSEIAPADDCGGNIINAPPGQIHPATVHHLPSPPLTLCNRSPTPGETCGSPGPAASVPVTCSQTNGNSHDHCNELPALEQTLQATLSYPQPGNENSSPPLELGQKTKAMNVGLPSQKSFLTQGLPSIAEGSAWPDEQAESDASGDSPTFARPFHVLAPKTPKLNTHGATSGAVDPFLFKTPSHISAGGRMVPPHTTACNTMGARGSVAMLAGTPIRTPHRTPLRTPKSVRRGPQPPTPHPGSDDGMQQEERILGTPDYLAPEILLQKPHGFAVDWWALGVCLYEFLTGLPPFNDQTPEAVFKNILERNIFWPEGEESLSMEAQAAVDALLTMEVDSRPAATETRALEFFSEIDWDNLLEMEPLFVPQPDDDMDTTYFKPKNDQRNLVMSAVDL